MDPRPPPAPPSPSTINVDVLLVDRRSNKMANFYINSDDDFVRESEAEDCAIHDPNGRNLLLVDKGLTFSFRARLSYSEAQGLCFDLRVRSPACATTMDFRRLLASLDWA